MEKAFGYATISSTNPDLSVSGMGRQRETIQRYARTHGYELLGGFEDTCPSGDPAKCKGLQALLKASAKTGVRTVLVEAWDRFNVSKKLLKTLDEHKINVVTTGIEGNGPVNPMADESFRPVMVAFELATAGMTDEQRRDFYRRMRESLLNAIGENN